MDPVYIFGHKNPDTDSICSAIAYAHLKNAAETRYIPARLGNLNLESQFVLNAFGVAHPVFLPHIYTRVQDVMTQNPFTATATSTIHDVGQIMHERQVRTVPIVDDDGRALGLVTESSMARSYVREMQVRGLQDTPTQLGKIATTLNGRLLVGNPLATVAGRVLIGAMNIQAMAGYVTPGDLVVVGNRTNAQETALRERGGCLIVTGGFDPEPLILELAAKMGTAVIVTPHDTFAAARLINLSASVLHMVDRQVLTMSPDMLVNEVREDLVESRSRVGMVVDLDGHLLGMLTRSNLVKQRRRQVILVDHSEHSQTVDGIEQADILEILDHHRLGSLQTSEPMEALIAPVGCTATLILRRYREMGLTPPRDVAGLMLSAILSDTMLLKSPTTTAEDHRAVAHLGELAGEEPLIYGKRLYEAKFDPLALTPEELLTYDLKRFDLGKQRIAVGQVEVADKGLVLRRKAELLETMARYQVNHDLDLVLLLVSDIFLEGSELLAAGYTRAVEKAFGVTLQEQSIFLPGVLSRKKQIIPPLTRVS